MSRGWIKAGRKREPKDDSWAFDSSNWKPEVGKTGTRGRFLGKNDVCGLGPVLRRPLGTNVEMLRALVIDCCVANYCKTWWLRRTHIYYVTVSVGQQLRPHFQLRVCHLQAGSSAWAVVTARLD